MKSPRAFRFGIIDESSLSQEEWIQKAQRVEQLGYIIFLIRDHFIQGEFNHQIAPVPALMAAADATKTLRVGSLVFSNDYRHPVMLAKEAATLDLLSAGRFELNASKLNMRRRSVLRDLFVSPKMRFVMSLCARGFTLSGSAEELALP